MKITFVSNYINHHQIPFCNALAAQEGVEFYFVQTEPMEQERIDMGWRSELSGLPYVKDACKCPQECQHLIFDSDVVIWGGAEDETMLKPRLNAEKMVFRYSERLYRTGLWKVFSPRGLWKKYQDHTKYRKEQVYLLCAGAYVPLDFRIIRSYPRKMFKWGYFPETRCYDIDKLIKDKIGNGESTKKEILWAARFIKCKHPEVVIELAKKLKEKRTDFHITMIGAGELEPMVKQLIEQEQLGQEVELVGYKKPREVREYMEKAAIYLVTSDKIEGWGAVLNEAMNSGCAVISSHLIGAAPYLIKHEHNGYMYRDGDADNLLSVVEMLLNNKELRKKVGKAAYETIIKEWNAEVAAQRLVKMAGMALEEGKIAAEWESGPGSCAPVLMEARKIPRL